jgi:hypothetical protein
VDSVTTNYGGQREPYRVRMPGFVSDKEIGLGDAIKRATTFVGIRPCGGCARRAGVLNSWITFTGQGPR